MKTETPSFIMGWTERVDFPDWGIEGVLAKLDTGAQTSALHVENMQALGGGKIRFEVVVGPSSTVHVTADLLRTARVRPSSGSLQEREVVKTTIKIGPLTRKVQIALVGRQNMACRMLVGRQALAGAVLVDPSRVHVTGRRRVKTQPHSPEHRYKDHRRKAAK